MFKRLIFLMLMSGFALEIGAQGVLYIDGSKNTSSSPTATSNGEVFLQTVGAPVVDGATDINITLAYGTSAANVSILNQVVSLLLSSSLTVGNGTLGETLSANGDISAFGGGKLFDASGTGYVFPTIAANANIYLDVFAWTGNFSSYAAAQASGSALVGSSGVFSENLVAVGAVHNTFQQMPALVLTHSLAPVPEPSTLTLMALGGLGLLGLHRRK